MQTSSTQPPNTLAKLDPNMTQIIRNFTKDTKNILKDNLIAEYLFGSYATNTQTSQSDIDILIIVKHYTSEFQWQMGGLASEYSLKYDVCVSPILKDIQVWNKNQQYRTLFFQEITSHGIKL